MSESLLLLSIDTCGPLGTVALARLRASTASTVLGQTELPGKTYSAQLVPAIRDLLSHHNVTLTEIATIVVTNGPGSFTGIRIGLSTAKGLAEPTSIPILAVSRLVVLAHKAKTIAAALDASRGELYFGDYSACLPRRGSPRQRPAPATRGHSRGPTRSLRGVPPQPRPASHPRPPTHRRRRPPLRPAPPPHPRLRRPHHPRRQLPPPLRRRNLLQAQTHTPPTPPPRHDLRPPPSPARRPRLNPRHRRRQPRSPAMAALRLRPLPHPRSLQPGPLQPSSLEPSPPPNRNRRHLRRKNPGLRRRHSPADLDGAKTSPS
jgi:tRNA threonylcarbamoyl adenosine modification protein YeaZ